MHEPPYRMKNMMPGMIMLWYGSIASIPSGWTLCDGTMGTPDLLEKFVRGAGPVGTPGTTGGMVSHNHDFTGDGHYHGIPQAAGCPGAGPNPCLDGLNTDSAPAVGSTDYTAALPPYHRLCYIMKL